MAELALATEVRHIDRIFRERKTLRSPLNNPLFEFFFMNTSIKTLFTVIIPVKHRSRPQYLLTSAGIFYLITVSIVFTLLKSYNLT